MKNKLLQKIGIGISIIIISLLHYFGGESDSIYHSFYKLLYFIPIILTAVIFGFKGGVFVAILVSLIYSPYILLTLGGFDEKVINELLDVLLFFVIGILTGTLVEKKNIGLKKLDHELERYKTLEGYTNSVIESIECGVIVTNNDMLITKINKGAEKITGTGNEWLGQNLLDAFAVYPVLKREIVKMIGQDSPKLDSEAVIQSYGKEMTVRFNLYPLNIGGIRRGIVLIFDDISKMKRLQKELLRNEKLAALGELSAGIAHEIRNPLGIIKAIEQTMKIELKDDPETLKELDIIDDEIERANKVVKALMELGRPAKGEKVLSSIESILDEVLIIAEKYMRHHGVRSEYSKKGKPYAYIDNEQMKQAFINIIMNAVQAMPEGGILKIQNCLENGEAHIVFTDTGKGIEKEIIEKIFNPFFTTKEEGTGLGLSIVQRIVDEHEGRIHVDSQPGYGTRFEMIIPARSECK